MNTMEYNGRKLLLQHHSDPEGALRRRIWVMTLFQFLGEVYGQAIWEPTDKAVQRASKVMPVRFWAGTHQGHSQLENIVEYLDMHKLKSVGPKHERGGSRISQILGNGGYSSAHEHVKMLDYRQAGQESHTKKEYEARGCFHSDTSRALLQAKAHGQIYTHEVPNLIQVCVWIGEDPAKVVASVKEALAFIKKRVRCGDALREDHIVMRCSLPDTRFPPPQCVGKYDGVEVIVQLSYNVPYRAIFCKTTSLLWHTHYTLYSMCPKERCRGSVDASGMCASCTGKRKRTGCHSLPQRGMVLNRSMLPWNLMCDMFWENATNNVCEQLWGLLCVMAGGCEAASHYCPGAPLKVD